jgi:hypothetical protein
LDDAAVKESRRILRRVQEHLTRSHLSLGAQQESLGMVEVIHHPVNRLPDLNYVTPRRNTAWVSGNFVEDGLARLRELDRQARVQYIEGLFPPLFARMLRDLGLDAERETPIMAYKADGFNGISATPVVMPPLPSGTTIETLTDQRGIETWWYVWRNAYYEVLTLGVEPLAVGRDMAAIMLGNQIDILISQHNFPAGVTRVTIDPDGQTAHILALALLREARTTEMTRLLLIAALRAALARGCTLVFAPGESEADRRLCRELGFMDFGSVVCYAAKIDGTTETAEHDVLVQPLLTLR